MSAASSRLTIPQLLNEAQRGAASAHVRYAKMLWELTTSDAATALEQLVTAMKWFATVAEVRRCRCVGLAAAAAAALSGNGNASARIGAGLSLLFWSRPPA